MCGIAGAIARHDPSDVELNLIEQKANQKQSAEQFFLLAKIYCQRGDADSANQLVRAILGGDVESVQRIESRRGTTLEALPKLDMPAYPHGIVVLMDRRSASASEFVAYSLQAAGRATVVGSRSAGAASMLGEPDVLPHGFQISIPDASPVNLKTGRNWDGSGVAPDMGGGDDPLFVARRILAGDVKPGVR